MGRHQHFLAHGLHLDVFDELLDHAEVNLGLEERDAELAQSGPMFSAANMPSPRRFLKTCCNLSGRLCYRTWNLAPRGKTDLSAGVHTIL
jgi:hypothetical protein